MSRSRRQWRMADMVPELFTPLRIVRTAEVHAAADFFQRQEMDIIQFVAEKG